MNIVRRLQNIWKLSEYAPGKPDEEYKTPGTLVSMIVKKPDTKAIFIPRMKKDPVKSITEAA